MRGTHLICFAYVLILFSQPVRAQNFLNGPAGEDTQSGLRPFHNLNGGEIDSVDLSTGKLVVNIPLVSYPQRGGKLGLGFALRYTNTGMYTAGCLPTAFSNGLCAIVFPYESGFSPVETGRPFGGAGCELTTSTFWQQTFVNSLFGSSDGSLLDSGGQPTIPLTTIQYACTAAVTTPDGASHPMEAINASTFVATDASGYRIDIVPGSDVRNPQHFASVLTDSQGNRYPTYFSDTPPATRVLSEDPNGNQILQGSDTGWVDTMGRNIPSFFGSVSGSTSDFSGCTGPLPITGAVAWNPPGVDGATMPMKFCFVSVPELNDGGDLHILNSDGTGTTLAIPALPTTSIQLQSVVLFNGTTWTFEYETHYGNLTKITFPTGGTISYTWEVVPRQVVNANNLPLFSLIAPQAVTSRTISPSDGSGPDGTWFYQYLRSFDNPNNLPIGQSPWATVVTDPAQNDTLHIFEVKAAHGSFIYPTLEHLETFTQSFQGPYTSGKVLRTVQKGYLSYGGTGTSLNDGAVLSSVTTTLDNGQQTRTLTSWDSGVALQRSIFDANGNWIGACTDCGRTLYGEVLGTQEYDSGAGAAGPLLRTISTPHLAFTNHAYLANNMLDLTSSKTVTDGAGNIAADTTYGYDETTPVSSGIMVQHDLQPPTGATRGNLTSETEIINAPPNGCNANVASSGSATSKVTYLDTGVVAQHFDSLGNSTTFSYSPTFAGAYPTQVRNALNQSVSTNYDFNTGLKTSITDQNGQTMSLQYDIMGRVTKFILPAQDLNGVGTEGSTTFTYNDTPRAVSVTQIETRDAANSLTQITFMDGLDRKIGGRMIDPEGDVLTKTVFDEFGRVSSATNPYRSVIDPTYGVTTNQYDALGRLTQVTHPDGSTSLTAYTGRAVQIQDRGNGTSRQTRISQSDGLGRMTSLCEVSQARQVNGNAPQGCGQDIPGTGFLTTYQYNGMGELTGVQQGGMARSLVYDTGGRLLNATNPESGTTCYQYDANGNLLSRTRPAPNQSDPLATVTASFQYDQLNRQTNISYSDSITPSVSKHYDTASELGIGLSNTVGRLSAVFVSSPAGQLVSGEVYSYDPMGRIIDNSQCTPQNCSLATAFPMQYSYDLLGNQLTSSNGQGVTFGYGYSANRLVSMTSTLADTNHPAALFHDALYTPLGDLSAVTLGNAISEALTYNRVGRITGYSSSPALSSIAQSSGPSPSTPFVANSRTSTPLWMPLSPSMKPSLHATIRILFRAQANRRKSDRATIAFQFSSLDALHSSASIQFAYRGQKALTVARMLARRINRDATLVLRAKAQRRGSSAFVDLVDRTTGKPSNYFVFASVIGSKGIPSIQARAVGALGIQPLLHGKAVGPPTPQRMMLGLNNEAASTPTRRVVR